MVDDTREIKGEVVNTALGEMKLEDTGGSHVNGEHEVSHIQNGIKRSRSSTPAARNYTQSPRIVDSASQTPRSEVDEDQDSIRGDIILTAEPGKTPKISRKSTQKVVSRPPPLYDDVEDATAEAISVFQVIKDCIYGSKYMGYSEHDALDCDCSEEFRHGKNHACGDDSDCINRATKMECVDGDCNCGRGCQNQRFQQKQYANVSVIKTEKKGYGLRANTDLNSNDFIFEYIGEVINEPTFRRRTIQYDAEGIKHFYFMSLTKSEFVDATKKGNLGRFCNHSCNPNCYVDKWVVGDKLRMGIFAERRIKAGEELVFNYNVDRYGADPQPCYCGEPNCSGYIGGKTQTERATKLSHATIEALGIDDGDGWDSAVAKKPRKKKTGEDDEEYVSALQPRGLDEEGVRKVMATLMQCKEKWIAVKLLSRLQRCDDDKVRNRVVQMHGYQILRATLTAWKDDNNVILQVLDILYKFPRLTRNKITDAKIESTIENYVNSEHEDVSFESKRLLEEWSKLEVAYRIPRKKFDPNAVSVFERRNTDRVEEITKSPSTPVAVAPTGPRSSVPQRSNFIPVRPPIRRPFNELPRGWSTAMDIKGNPYYYSQAGTTTWVRPTLPAAEPLPPPKQPPKSVQTAKALQDIIDSITTAKPVHTPTQAAPFPESTPKDKKRSTEKWRALPQDKQMKLYENTLFPHIKHVMQKFTKQLPKEDLKKFAKEIGKKLVASDFKNGRVEDPTKISDKQEKKVKKYVRDYFEKAVQKKKVLDTRKRDKERPGGKADTRHVSGSNGVGNEAVQLKNEESDVEPDIEGVELSPSNSPLDAPSSSHDTPTASFSDLTTVSNSNSYSLKRSRDEEGSSSPSDSHKRLKEELCIAPPPPPPPPPVEGMPIPDEEMEGVEAESLVKEETEEDRELRKQEEDLMRENEEAVLMELDGSLRTAEDKLGFTHVNTNGVSVS